MLLTYIYIYIYIDIVPDVPDTSGESKNNIGPPSGGPKSVCVALCAYILHVHMYHTLACVDVCVCVHTWVLVCMFLCIIVYVCVVS